MFVTLACAGMALCAIAGLGLWATHARQSANGHVSAATVTRAPAIATATPSAPAQAASPSAEAARPTSIQIPAIDVHTSLQQLGLDSSGSLEPPTNLTQAGWYTGSSVPGNDGPAVIAGHVDSTKGPAVFFRLKSLKPGDMITVGLSSGQSVDFQVMAVQHYPKNAFPTAEVYGARPDPELRVITCGGSFAAGHYLDNVVVYAAELAAPRTATR
jgi:LPXTG-site transpeptidase (sortase) family protein